MGLALPLGITLHRHVLPRRHHRWARARYTLGTPPEETCQLARERDQTAGEKENCEQHGDGKEDGLILPGGLTAPEDLREPREKSRSHNWTPKVSPSPNVVIYQDVGRHQEVKRRWKEKAHEVRVECASHASEKTPHGKRQELISSDVDPKRQRQIIGHTNALPDESQTTVLQLVEDEQDDHHEAERKVALVRLRSQDHPQETRFGNTTQPTHATR